MILGKLAMVIAVLLALLAGWRFSDNRSDRAEMDRLLALQTQDPSEFSALMVADLPEPARRFFMFAIAEGTPLLPVARLEMSGQFSLGTKDEPNYFDMRAEQVLAAPEGFVWKMTSETSHLGLSGSDTAHWTRFWLGGVLPVTRFGGVDDHARSAFGRYVAEAVIWTPAAVLPGPNVTWAGLDEDRAVVTIRHGELEQVVEVIVAPDGQPTHVVFQRWSDANPEKTYQFQQFGAELSDFHMSQGFRVPRHVEAGNLFGTEGYFPFYVVDVHQIDFPMPP